MENFKIDHCLVNLSNSILKKFNAKPFHETLKEVDEAIKNSQKIVLFLFDGMGSEIIKKHLPEDSFIRTHFLTQISSTFPPTTVAATTAVCSAKYPGETGWLGWSIYYPELNSNIDCFTGNYSNIKNKSEGRNYHFQNNYYQDVTEIINNENKAEIASIIRRYPIDKNGPKHLWNFFSKVKKTFKEGNQKYVYAYWDQPDKNMHHFGTTDKKVHRYIKRIDRGLEKFNKRNPEITLLVIADHGQIDVNYLNLNEHKDLCELKEGFIYLEKRSAAFRVKDENKEKFKELFNKYYSDKFYLFSKEEIIKNNFFGPHQSYSDFTLKVLPDYLALGKDNYSFFDDTNEHLLKGHHGGISKDEFNVDVIFAPSKYDI